MNTRIIISDEKIAEILALRAKGMSYKKIGTKLGVCSNTAIEALYPARATIKRAERREKYQIAIVERGVRASTNHVVHSHYNKMPPEVEEERTRYEAIVPTLSQEYFGDPRAGRSALDKLRAQGK